MNDTSLRPLFSADAIHRKVAELGRDIERDLGAEDPLLLCIANGAAILAGDLVRAINLPLRFEFVQVLYRTAEDSDDVIDLHFPLSVDVRDQTLVIVKDVVGTGVIDTYLSNQLLRRGAKSVHIVTLIDLPELRRTAFAVDYRLFTPKKNGIFVGYGLKHGGRYGNLDYIGLLPGDGGNL